MHPSRAAFSWRSTIDLAPVADFDHKDAKRVVLYVADDPIVADAIAPVCAEMRAGERLACGARVIEHSEALSKKACDASGFALVEFREPLGRRGRQLNPPNQDCAPLPLV